MRWSLKVGKLFGIDLYVHVTFVLILAWVGLVHYLEDHSVAAALSGIVFILIVFGIVVLHELGHALTARRFGIKTRDITLLPIGGVARLERMPDKPWQELLVALAGPAVNVALAALFFGVLYSRDGGAELTATDMMHGSYAARLFWLNIALAVFNMLPAFPMDGGRVLRALLALKLDYVLATRIAARLGQGMALLFGLLGLMYNPFLAFIALFVWIGAADEAAMVQLRYAISGIPISRAMITEFRTLAPGDRLSLAVSHVLDGFQHDFPVIHEGNIVGVLTRTGLMEALSKRGPDALVGEAMSARYPTADPGDMLEKVLAKLQEARAQAAAVVREGKLLGMITMENIGEFLMIQSALGGGTAKA